MQIPKVHVILWAINEELWWIEISLILNLYMQVYTPFGFCIVCKLTMRYRTKNAHTGNILRGEFLEGSLSLAHIAQTRVRKRITKTTQPTIIPSPPLGQFTHWLEVSKFLLNTAFGTYRLQLVKGPKNNYTDDGRKFSVDIGEVFFK